MHSCQFSRILRETHAFWGGIAVFLYSSKIEKYDWKLKISRILSFKSWQLWFYPLRDVAKIPNIEKDLFRLPYQHLNNTEYLSIARFPLIYIIADFYS